MKNKKIVATLLHACTWCCVSAYNMQGSDVNGNVLQPFPGQVAANWIGNDRACSDDEFTLSALNAPGSELSPEIRLLLKACSPGKDFAISAERALRHAPVPDTAGDFLINDTCQRPPAIQGCFTKNACFALNIFSEGNATWIEHCLTGGP